MSASLLQGLPVRSRSGRGGQTQIFAPPGTMRPDFSPLRNHVRNAAALDQVSIADLLRNSFVYPPHSIYGDVKFATSGFEAGQNLHHDPRFHFDYQSASVSRPRMGAVDGAVLLKTYHDLLCEAVSRSSNSMRSPWLMQSGGKDSTSMAIAVAEARPDAVCMTYLGGREENEVDSARFVARQLGLRHETLVCDPVRAYERYLAMVPRMPLLTADFAMLSYADLATEVVANGGDGVIDALGSDNYFGMPINWRQRLRALLALRLRLPRSLVEAALVSGNFRLSYALGTLQMDGFERCFPGSRFSDAEVDALLGCSIADRSRQRLQLFRADIVAAKSMEAQRRVAATIVEAATFGKGMFTTSALSLLLAYPYRDAQLREWIFHDVPDALLIGLGGINKVLVRQHIAQHFQQLPYVRAKGSFRFDLCGLAQQRFDQVHAFAMQGQSLLPGAVHWLESHRHRMDNKYHASKFYLLAVTLPWLLDRSKKTTWKTRHGR
ncbi:MAG: asparagine synthase-related protein [Rhodanobacter sp.]